MPDRLPDIRKRGFKTPVDRKTQKKNSRKLLIRFLRGSKTLFVLSMLASVVSALCDMLSPQIVRLAVDYALGGADASALPGWVAALADRFGGFSWLGGHIWVMAAALLVVALCKAAAQYGFRVAKTAGAERLVKTARDSLFRHIERLPYSWHMKHRTGDIIHYLENSAKVTKSHEKRNLKVLLLVISKSGGTLDTMSNFMVIYDALQKFDNIDVEVVAVTDPNMEKQTLLKKLAIEKGWPQFAVPDGVGGRFTIFCEVGLTLAACIGFDMAGAFMCLEGNCLCPRNS